jgi:hypothetical protein
MSYRLLLRSMVVVGALGIGVPGCFLFGSGEPEGRICASPVQGGVHCVRAKNHGVDPSAIDKVEQKLNAGDIKGAALAHDVLLQSMEGT